MRRGGGPVTSVIAALGPVLGLVLVLVLGTTLAGCAADTPPEAAPSTSGAPAGSADPAAGSLPNLVGRPLPDAASAARSAGFTYVGTTDATGAGRRQFLDRD